jgi:hypothetical protein
MMLEIQILAWGRHTHVAGLLRTSPWAIFELTTLPLIGTDCKYE